MASVDISQYVKENNFKKIIETYEQNQALIGKSNNANSLYFEVGRAYYLAETPYNNASKAVDLFNKSIKLRFYPAKSYLAFCYIFGEGVPKNLQKATDLFQEAYDEGIKRMRPDYLADFMLQHLTDMDILLRWLMLNRTDDIKYALSTPLRRQSFSCIIRPWTFSPSNRMEVAERTMKNLHRLRQDLGKSIEYDRFCYDPSRLRTLSDTWGYVYDPTRLHSPDTLNWIAFLHNEKGFPKERIIEAIESACRSLIIPEDTEESNQNALNIYKIAISCFAEIYDLPPLFESVPL